MNDIKNWYTSKTIWGIIIAFVATLLKFFNVELSASFQTELVEFILQVITLISLGYAGVSRYTATSTLK